VGTGADLGAIIGDGDLESLLAAQEADRVTQKKWLADVAANHLSGQPALSAKKARLNARDAQAVKELPQPQFRAALGF
jgi:hypothetical protein